MITIIKLINKVTSHSYFLLHNGNTSDLLLGDFQVYTRLLPTIVSILYIRSPQSIPLITGSSYPLASISLFPTSSCWQPHSTISMSLSFLDSRYKGVAPYLCKSPLLPYPVSLTRSPLRACSQKISRTRIPISDSVCHRVPKKTTLK